ncbi:MAG: D-glycero-beta-D-manno-heptose 1-phosphate adenylyltransferase [Lewinellaceae bacterium]|nr:D-glycero-beta-D-manno-heptose 1-phosphate adenylyltransferase [Lewinellaceae bacterium]
MSYLDNVQKKLMSWDMAAAQVQAWQARGDRIVFTNGCFDLLHYGHLHYLAQARDLGDRLVIGLNSGESVSRLKGPTRPINDESTRQLMLASLAFVDAVVVFGEDTPLALIQQLNPDVLVKGGDYAPETIVGASWVEERGGQVVVLPFVSGYSTTALETRIKNG